MRVNKNDTIYYSDTKIVQKASSIIKLVSIKELKEIVGEVNCLINNDLNYLDIISDIIRFNEYRAREDFVCCPSCFTFSSIHDYINPVSNWNDIFHKYRKDIVKSFLRQKYERYNRRIRLPSMKDITLDLSDDKVIPFTEFQNDENGLVYTCPHCGKKLPTKKSFGRRPDFDIDSRYLSREPNWYYQNQFDYNYEVFEKEDDDKVTLSIIRYHLFPNIYGKMLVKKSNARATFNTKTRMSYFFREIDMETKKPLIEDARRLVNATYGTDYNSFTITNEMFQALSDAFCRKRGIPCFSTERIVEELSCRLTTNFAAILNRYLEKGEDYLLYLLKFNTKLTKESMKELYKIDNKLFLKIINQKKIKNKKIISLFAKNPLLILSYDFLKNIGFTNNDVIINLLEDSRILDIVYHNVSYETDYRNLEKTVSCYNFSNFVSDYLSVKSESELAKKLLNGATWFQDVCTMYCQIKMHIVMTDDTKKVLFKGSFNEIHDRLVRINNNIRDRGYYIPYEEKELSLNGKVDNYYFELAKNNLDMKDVGNKMHICVGGYGNFAFSKSCVIVFMKNVKTKEPEVCIELSPDRKQLIQAKDYCNGVVKEEKRKYLKTFLVKNNISFENCYDAECLSNVKAYEDFEKSSSNNGYKIFDSKDNFEKVFLEEDDLNFGFNIVYREETPFI